MCVTRGPTLPDELSGGPDQLSLCTSGASASHGGAVKRAVLAMKNDDTTLGVKAKVKRLKEMHGDGPPFKKSPGPPQLCRFG